MTIAICTAVGKTCWLDQVEENLGVFDAATIASALSKLCRFGGHCNAFYSVAQHSVLALRMLEIACSEQELSRELRLAALLHDGHEAFWGFGDIQTPAKHLDPHVEKFLKELAKRFDVMIAKSFGISPELFESPVIRVADRLATSIEIRDLMPATFNWSAAYVAPQGVYPITPLNNSEAEELFLTNLYLLQNT